jgi:hypothetical protein
MMMIAARPSRSTNGELERVALVFQDALILNVDPLRNE